MDSDRNTPEQLDAVVEEAERILRGEMDPHDRAHEESGSRVCMHPDCRADDINDDRAVGLL